MGNLAELEKEPKERNVDGSLSGPNSPMLVLTGESINNVFAHIHM